MGVLMGVRRNSQGAHDVEQRIATLFYLNAQTGSIKGTSWPIGADKILLGRGDGCRILIDDSLVSRQHCEVVETNEGLTVRDLGSSNATLVNGKPVTESLLQAGDELAVGRMVFLVTITPRAEVQSKPEGGAFSTVRLSQEESAQLGDNTAELFAMAYPNSVQDLAALYALGRDCSRVESVRELMLTVFDEVRERFRPTAAWIALARGAGDELRFYTRQSCAAGETVHPAPEMMRKAQKALQKREGLVIPILRREQDERRLATLLVSPIALGEQLIGAMIVRCDASEHAYGEGDLRFLLSVAHTVAPYFHAMEQVEVLRRDNERLRALTRTSTTLIGNSRAIRQVRSLIAKAAPSNLSILIQGETGTGKELAAQMVHDHSARSKGPLVTVNCAAIPDRLLESELFGHEKGAFTGAIEKKIGRIEQADGGTLFLDEIGDLSLENQAKLLRAIESGTFTRVGANRESRVNIRVVAASNKILTREVRSGHFREDLYHRLNGIEILMPPLRERPSDIRVLATHFLTVSLNRAKRPVTGFTDAAFEFLKTRKWPGNVRQLRNAIERAVTLAKGENIDESDLRESSGGAGDEEESLCTLVEIEKRHIERTLLRCDGNIREAAKILDIGRSTLYTKIADYGISP